MSMDKRWAEMFARLDAIENELKDLKRQSNSINVTVTKEKLTKIKGVGDALADEILKAMHR